MPVSLLSVPLIGIFVGVAGIWGSRNDKDKETRYAVYAVCGVLILLSVGCLAALI